MKVAKSWGGVSYRLMAGVMIPAYLDVDFVVVDYQHTQFLFLRLVRLRRRCVFGHVFPHDRRGFGAFGERKCLGQAASARCGPREGTENRAQRREGRILLGLFENPTQCFDDSPWDQSVVR